MSSPKKEKKNPKQTNNRFGGFVLKQKKNLTKNSVKSTERLIARKLMGLTVAFKNT